MRLNNAVVHIEANEGIFKWKLGFLSADEMIYVVSREGYTNRKAAKRAFARYAKKNDISKIYIMKE